MSLLRNSGQQEVTAFANDEIQEYYSYGLNRFLDEARVLSRLLSHPGIVSFEDFFATNGTAYLVMEYLEGQTFKDYLKKGEPALELPPCSADHDPGDRRPGRDSPLGPDAPRCQPGQYFYNQRRPGQVAGFRRRPVRGG